MKRRAAQKLLAEQISHNESLGIDGGNLKYCNKVY